MYIISITTKKREREIPEVQEVLTEYGENILSRLGVHNCKYVKHNSSLRIGNARAEKKEQEGLIIIVYDSKDVEEFVEKLHAINHVHVNYMET